MRNRKQKYAFRWNSLLIWLLIVLLLPALALARPGFQEGPTPAIGSPTLFLPMIGNVQPLPANFAPKPTQPSAAAATRSKACTSKPA